VVEKRDLSHPEIRSVREEVPGAVLLVRLDRVDMVRKDEEEGVLIKTQTSESNGGTWKLDEHEEQTQRQRMFIWRREEEEQNYGVK
jgi:hypothetical protein